MSKKFKISTIIPVYNVENYLSETMESIINQSIGIENIQIILVNDGSLDSSESLCLQYRDKYHDNIVYIKQENAGVSAARNNGLTYAEGEYINFLDSDDTWDLNAYEDAINIMDKNKDVSLVFYPLKFFDGEQGYHTLNYMFNECRKIDIRDDYDCIKLQSCSIIFRYDIVKKYKYCEKLKISEDSRFVTEILFDNPIAYISNRANYNYRKRLNNTSAIQNSAKSKTWYVDTPYLCYEYLIELSLKKFGKVIRYLQFLILYDYKWRLNVSAINVLDSEELNNYYKSIYNCISIVDDKLIIDFALYDIKEKLYVLNIKYNDCNLYKIVEDKLFINDYCICPLSKLPLIIDSINIVKDDYIEIYGHMEYIPNVLEKVFITQNDKKYEFEYYELDKTTKKIFSLGYPHQFNVVGIYSKLKIEQGTINIIGMNLNNNSFNMNFEFSKTEYFNNEFLNLYFKTDNYYLKNNKKNIIVYKRNILNSFYLELGLILGLIVRKRFINLFYHCMAKLYGIFRRKEIWIVSDRINMASDNGEAFFDFLMSKKKLGVKYYFVISKNCQDYVRLKKKYKNHLVANKTLKHKLLHFNASKIISSHADDYVTNIVGKGKIYNADLYRFKFIFLQHGIIKDDLSPWLSVNRRKIDLFITSSKLEYDSMVSKEYHYNYPNEIFKLTGLARYDKLMSDNCNDINGENIILLMPTWRFWLVSGLNPKTGKRIYNEKFKETEYFKFYNSLINDKRLTKVLSEKGYKIRFIPHINMFQQLTDFESNDYIEFASDSVNYEKEFKQGKILITDYSSVFFDFAYLGKPVVYCQFDYDTFFKGQIYDKGYFSYEKDGFGPICYSVDQTVDELIKLINSEHRIKKQYLDRINSFYKYRENKNCERIYNEIIKLDGKHID